MVNLLQSVQWFSLFWNLWAPWGRVVWTRLSPVWDSSEIPVLPLYLVLGSAGNLSGIFKNSVAIFRMWSDGPEGLVQRWHQAAPVGSTGTSSQWPEVATGLLQNRERLVQKKDPLFWRSVSVGAWTGPSTIWMMGGLVQENSWQWKWMSSFIFLI